MLPEGTAKLMGMMIQSRQNILSFQINGGERIEIGPQDVNDQIFHSLFSLFKAIKKSEGNKGAKGINIWKVFEPEQSDASKPEADLTPLAQPPAKEKQERLNPMDDEGLVTIFGGEEIIHHRCY